MLIEILINNDVVVPPTFPPDPAVGALAEFTGTVRGDENGAPITALVYEAYQPMAEVIMRRILESLEVTYPCIAVRVHHRTGTVRLNEAAIHVAVRSRHRAEAFGLLTAFMNRLKQDVPIWKTDALTQ